MKNKLIILFCLIPVFLLTNNCSDKHYELTKIQNGIIVQSSGLNYKIQFYKNDACIRKLMKLMNSFCNSTHRFSGIKSPIHHIMPKASLWDK